MSRFTLRTRLRALYDGPSEAADRFRYTLLAFDVLTITFLIATSFFNRTPMIELADLAIGLILLTEVILRIWSSADPRRDVFSVYFIADLAVILSLIAPFVGDGEGLAFLRVLRLYRVFHSPQTLRQLRQDWPVFNRNQTTVRAALNLLIFVFLMTALVYETQRSVNDKITTYLDALYFTVTTLSTTGFGDVTLVGNSGKLLSVGIMIFGISLFLRLIQVLLRPVKAHFPCPTCGLRRHDHDAVHCKACGTVLNIPDDGAD
jgi:voltage-gated potassium channel